MRSLLTVAFLTLVSACSTGRSAFPTPAQLDALLAAPPPPEPFKSRQLSVERWALAGPFPERLEPVVHASANGFERLLDRVVGSGRANATEAMHCVAREVGRFVLETGARPDSALRSAIEGRCGSQSPRVAVRWLEGDAEESLAEEKLLESWGKDLNAMLDEEARSEAVPSLGVWFGRKGKKSIILVSREAPQVRLKPVSRLLSADGTRFVLEGQALQALESMAASITRGATGYGRCERDETVPYPNFRFTCALEPKDAQITLELSLFEKDRFLGAAVFRTVLERPGVDNTWTAARLTGGPQVVAGAADVPAAFLAAVNRARSTAGMQPLTLEGAQSAAANALVTRYFGAAEGKTLDTIALGMVAGYQVKPRLVDGDFGDWAAAGTRDVAQMVDGLLASPSMRRVLLNRKASLLAVGAQADAKDDTLGLIFSSYVELKDFDPVVAATTYIAGVNQTRAGRGLQPAQWTVFEKDPSLRVKTLLAGGADPSDVLEELLQDAVNVLQRPSIGYFAVGRDLDEIEPPKDLLAPPSYALFSVVSTYRPKGEPHDRYVAFFLRVELPGAQLASRD